MTKPDHSAELVALRSLVRKFVDDISVVYNEGGYLVAPYDDGGDVGTRCIDLSPEEIAALKAALIDGGDGA